MPEPFKNWFNADLIRAMAVLFDRVDGFDRDEFERIALTGLDDLELMQRSDRISDAMTASLPLHFPAILSPLTDILHPDTESGFNTGPLGPEGLHGWALMPVGKFVATHGMGCPGESLTFLREMTMRSSAEFAVRPFYKEHPDLTLAHTAEWVRDENQHVRRLASEGSRPRLPWGMRLHGFVDDPAPLLPLLTALRDDPSDYVRRSVANNLNDIAKDHPDLVADVAAHWMIDAPEPRQKLVKHACRSLIKSGHVATLKVFGYGGADTVSARLTAAPQVVQLGQSLTLTATLNHTADAAQRVLIDIILRFLRADGTHGAKVFKWTETTLPPGQPLVLQKRLPLRDVTTRRHYPGRQFAALQVNGQVLAEAQFNLTLPG